MFCSLSCEVLFVDDKISTDNFKAEIIPSLKAKDRLKISQEVTMNYVRDKSKKYENYHIK